MKKTKSTLLSNLKKATIEMFLLKLLAEGDMYGYQLSQELKKRSNGNYTILEGSMYPILYRLTDQNHISFYEKKVGKRQTRVYYHLEESGLAYLSDLKQSYADFTDIIAFLLTSNEGDTYEKQTEKE
ncbi:MAG: helix-turn-helix transcriptional regulator [Lachnospiraceae bacterium]|nr:helix-turn-helix transcriptional regulator [Lachnospiraceae bacterium]